MHVEGSKRTSESPTRTWVIVRKDLRTCDLKEDVALDREMAERDLFTQL